MNQKKFVRLYKSHDMDLIAIMLSEEVNFSRLVKACLKLHANGKGGYIKLPQLNIPEISLNGYTCTYYINDEKDKDILDMFESIDSYKENSFVKCIVRESLFPGYSSYYFNDEKAKSKYGFYEDRQLPVYKWDASNFLALGKSPELESKLIEKIETGIVVHREPTEEETVMFKEVVTESEQNGKIKGTKSTVTKKKKEKSEQSKGKEHPAPISEKAMLEEEDPFGAFSDKNTVGDNEELTSPIIPGFKIPVQTY